MASSLPPGEYVPGYPAQAPGSSFTVPHDSSTALLSYNIYHTGHPFKGYNSLFFAVFLQTGTTITTPSFRTFSSPQREILCPLAITCPPPQ